MNNLISKPPTKSQLKYIKKLEGELKCKTKKNEILEPQCLNLLEKFKKLQDNIEKTSNHLDKKQKLVKKQTVEFKEKSKEMNLVKHEVNKLQRENASFKKQIEQLSMKNINLNKLRKDKESSEKLYSQLQAENNVLTKSKDDLKAQIKVLKVEVNASKKQFRNKNMDKAKGGSVKSTMRREDLVERQPKLDQSEENNGKKLKTELDKMKKDNRKYMITINTLEKEKSRAIGEKLNLTKKLERGLDEIKTKERETCILKKNLKEATNVLNHQKSTHDSLQELVQVKQCEIEVLKPKIKTALQQIIELNKNVRMKEQQTMKKDSLIKKKLTGNERLKAELDATNRKIKMFEVEATQIKCEVKRLHKTITDNDCLVRKQSKIIEQPMGGRKVLGVHNIASRNATESTSLKKVIKTSQPKLQNGEQHNKQQSSNAVKLLKIENKPLRQEKNVSDTSMKTRPAAKQISSHTKKSLIKEKGANREQEKHTKDNARLNKNNIKNKQFDSHP